MTDVFLRRALFYREPLRRALLEATTARWEKDFEANLIPVIGTTDIKGVRLGCDEKALSEVYVVTDDDLLILGKNWVKRVTDILLRHPEYGAISTLSVIERENTLRPPNDTDELYEAHAIGAPMVIRKGVIAGVPEMDLNSECMVIYEHLKAKGLKEGIVNPAFNLRHNHCGNGFSNNLDMRWGY